MTDEHLFQLKGDIDQLGHNIAELSERFVRVEEAVAQFGSTAEALRELIDALRNQPAPQVNVNPQITLPQAEAPHITLPASPGFEVQHTWEGNRIVRSTITSKGDPK
jgi:hypothetical protein